MAPTKTTVLFCRETPGLTLGPGNEIHFINGFAEVDGAEDAPWREWVKHPGTPFIREVTGGMPNDNEVRCPFCGDAQKDAAANVRHVGDEHPPKPVPLQPPDQKPVFVHEVGGSPVLVQPPAEPIPAATEPQLIFPKGVKQMVAQSGEITPPAGAAAKPGTASTNVKTPKRTTPAKGVATPATPAKTTVGPAAVHATPGTAGLVTHGHGPSTK